MAGSLKYFLYTTTGGTNYGIRMDESNGEAVGNTDVTDADLPLVALPRNIVPRYVLYRSVDGLTTRRIPVTANNVDVADLPATIVVANPLQGIAAGITLQRQSFIGEIQKPVIAIDTGLLDADVS